MLENLKQERFAQRMANGESPAKAYVAAGFSGKGAPQSASRLLRRGDVRARVAELRGSVVERTLEAAAVQRSDSGSGIDLSQKVAQLAGRTLERWAEEKSRAEAGLGEFIRQAWHVLEPATPYVPGWHIDAICLHLEAVTRGWIRNLLINVPPRHMKSLSVAVFWPCWEWIAHPQRRWLFASYALSLSVRDSLKCRRLIQSDWYQRNWGDRFQLCGDQNQKMRWENDQTGYRVASSVGGSLTGEGGDRLVADDPHNIKDRESDVIRERVLRWWDEVMSTRLNDPKTGAKVIVMQRVHERDLSGHVLEQGGWEHLCLPAEYEG